MDPPPSSDLDRLGREMLAKIMRSNKEILVAPSFRDAVLGFYHAVRWDEPWIMALLSLHACMLLLAVATRRRPNFQIGMLLTLCAAVWGAQYLNPYLAIHWRELGFTQNYFDARGVFISFAYSLPLLAVGGLQMVGGKGEGCWGLLCVAQCCRRAGSAARQPAVLRHSGGGCAAVCMQRQRVPPLMCCCSARWSAGCR